MDEKEGCVAAGANPGGGWRRVVGVCSPGNLGEGFSAPFCNASGETKTSHWCYAALSFGSASAAAPET